MSGKGRGVRLEKLLEVGIKSLLLNNLRDSGQLTQSSLIMNELTVGGFERRADLSLLDKGKLITFEIKSASDSLNRLGGQIAKYLEYFDKVTVIADKKHVKRVLAITPSNVGVWELKSDGFTIRRKGVLARRIEKQKLIEMMDVTELSKLANQNNIKCDRDRYSLEEHLSTVSYASLRENVKLCLERKFRSVNSQFWKSTANNKISISDLDYLSRFKGARDRIGLKRSKSENFWKNIDTYVQDFESYTLENSKDLPNHHQCRLHRNRHRNEVV